MPRRRRRRPGMYNDFDINLTRLSFAPTNAVSVPRRVVTSHSTLMSAD